MIGTEYRTSAMATPLRLSMIVPAPNIDRNCGIRPAGFRESSNRGGSGAARGRGRHS